MNKKDSSCNDIEEKCVDSVELCDSMAIENNPKYNYMNSKEWKKIQEEFNRFIDE